MARILIIADDGEVFHLLRYVLQQGGHHAHLVFASDFRKSHVRGSSNTVVIVDSDLGCKGDEICQQILSDKASSRVRLLLLEPSPNGTAESEQSRTAHAYLPMPLNPLDVLRKINDLVNTESAEPERIIEIRQLRIDPFACSVTRSGKPVPLSFLAFRLLYYLAAHPNMVCTRDHLLKLVWFDPEVTPRTVDVFVRRLRTQIEEDPDNPVYIKSVRGKGYLIQTTQNKI